MYIWQFGRKKPMSNLIKFVSPSQGTCGVAGQQRALGPGAVATLKERQLRPSPVIHKMPSRSPKISFSEQKENRKPNKSINLQQKMETKW